MAPTTGMDEPGRSAAADDDGTDQIDFDTPRSGLATPQPDLHDKRLPGIMSYFNQVRPASIKRLFSGNYTVPSKSSTSASSNPATTVTTASPAIPAIPATSSTSAMATIIPNLTSATSGETLAAIQDALPTVPSSQSTRSQEQSDTQGQSHLHTTARAPEPDATKSRPYPPTADPVALDLSETLRSAPLSDRAAEGAAVTYQSQRADDAQSHSIQPPPPLTIQQKLTPPTAPADDVAPSSESLAVAALTAIHPYPTPPVSVREAAESGEVESGLAEVERESEGHISATSTGSKSTKNSSPSIRNPSRNLNSQKKIAFDATDGRAYQETQTSTPLAGVVTPSSVLARHFSVPSLPSLATTTLTSTIPVSTRSPASTSDDMRASLDSPGCTDPLAVDISAPPAATVIVPAAPAASFLRSASVGQLKKLTTMTRIKSGQSTPVRSLSTINLQQAESPISALASDIESARSTLSHGTDPTSGSRTASSTPTPAGIQAPAPKGKLTIKIKEARGLRRTRDPYVVAVFQRSELISAGPRQDDISDEVILPGTAVSSIPIQRQLSDNGRPMAIPMRSRQSSNTSVTDYGAFRNRNTRRSFTNPKWDAEAVFDVVDSNMLVDISVYDHSATGEEFVGHVDFQAKSSEKHGPISGWFPLRGHADTIAEDTPIGEVYVEAIYQRTERKHYGPDDFEILRLIGKGTFGQVYQVRKRDTRRIYAMKVLSKKKIVQKKEVAHTVGERNILVRTATSDSPFIVGLKFSFQTPSDLYLVTDYMSGGELFWHLQKEGRFEEGRAKFYIAELILAMEHLHDNNIVYRDLKPENILLDANGHIALCDFGLSKANLTKNDTTNTFCGTTEYLAPEVLLDEAGYTKMVDFWSLGVLVFEMCCGWSPFYAEDTQQMYKNIAFGKVRFPKDTLSAEGRSFVKGLLNRNPKHRLGATKDAAELMEHPFFRDIDWDALSKKLITPPFKPKLKSDTDVSYFDPMFTDAMDKSGSLNERAAALARGLATSTPLSPSMQANFQGFTFVDESALDDNMRGRPSYNNNHDDSDDETHNTDVYHNSRNRTDDDWDDINDIAPRNPDRMSGVLHSSNNDEHMFGGANFDM
ncbi:Serine/threonine-protein kinase [Sporothrix epigloea]|uniref:Serine/threonine-protein kinase n=1 Tax=Sporothrix epigloea TaxID=1892477 RepID=A0ABP0DR07_9PEZI